MNYKTLLIRKEKISQNPILNRQTQVKINRKVAFFIEYNGTKKSKSCCHSPFYPPNFCCSLKLLSPTLQKLVNWILLSPPPLSSDPDNPPKFGTCRNPPWQIGYHGNKETSISNLWTWKFCSYPVSKSYQVSKWWRVPIWSNEPVTGQEVENTPPRAYRVNIFETWNFELETLAT